MSTSVRAASNLHIFLFEEVTWIIVEYSIEEFILDYSSYSFTDEYALDMLHIRFFIQRKHLKEFPAYK